MHSNGNPTNPNNAGRHVEFDDEEQRRAISLSIQHHALMLEESNADIDIDEWGQKVDDLHPSQQPRATTRTTTTPRNNNNPPPNYNQNQQPQQPQHRPASALKNPQTRKSSGLSQRSSLSSEKYKTPSYDTYGMSALGEVPDARKSILYTQGFELSRKAQKYRFAMAMMALLVASFLATIIGRGQITDPDWGTGLGGGLGGTTTTKPEVASQKRTGGLYEDDPATVTGETYGDESTATAGESYGDESFIPDQSTPTATTTNDRSIPEQSTAIAAVGGATADFDEDVMHAESDAPIFEKAGDIFLPPIMDHTYLDLWTTKPTVTGPGPEIPVFWDVPRAGGTAVKFILGKCHGLTIASEDGAGHETENLERFHSAGGDFLNVDMNSHEGISHAKKLKIASSGQVDVIFSSFMHDIGELLSNKNPGRMFTILRHPVERAISFYYHEQAANMDYAGMSVAEFFTMRKRNMILTDNWMTRMITNRQGGRLTDDDANLAMEILRKKVLIGLAVDVPESLYRFKKYFGWKNTRSKGETNSKTCEQRFMTPNVKKNPAVEDGGEAWNLIMEINKYDLKVYEYAVYLFGEQKKML